jgi:branched-chain amino acid transport system ATP-binding protein
MSNLIVRGISAGYGKVNVVRDVSLAVPEGRRIALVGSNGAGKSTIGRTIIGLLALRGGSVQWDRAPIESMSVHQRTRAGIATVPEGRLLFPDCTVTENLVAASTWGQPKIERQSSIETVFDLFSRLRERSAQRVGTLSGGEQQMVAIGRALMTRPRLLMLDEPSIGLAPKVVGEIFEALGKLTGSGLSLLLVEQNVQLSLRSVDYAYVLRRGELVLEGDAADLLDHPFVREAYLGD